jgi:MFS family permease
MIYPVIPLFLTQILGAGPLALGLVESVAEGTSSLLKIFSGIQADRLVRRKPFLFWGYGISGIFRPLIALAHTWPAVLLFRFLDRTGKGFRSAPQDALIADVTPPAKLGASYGFHSSMDNAGQLLGPLVAGILLLPAVGFSFQSVIFFSVIPGLAAWLMLFGIKEPPPRKITSIKKQNLIGDWVKLGVPFKVLLIVLALFTLGNSTDAFLIVRLRQLGVSAWMVALFWGLHGGVRMVSSYLGGSLSDRFGRKTLIVSGWFYYALIYLTFALVTQKEWAVAAFLAYGLFYGLCEPAEKAFVGDLAPPSLRGTAFGYYYLVCGLGVIPASLLFGWVGQTWGYPAAFGLGALLAGLASGILICVQKK